jgi:hypothetical protein
VGESRNSAETNEKPQWRGARHHVVIYPKDGCGAGDIDGCLQTVSQSGHGFEQLLGVSPCGQRDFEYRVEPVDPDA